MKTYSILFFLFALSNLQAQLLDLYTNYRSNWLLINPAATNSLIYQARNKTKTIDLSFRQQWLGENVQGAPRHANLRYEHYLDPDLDDMKWGVLINMAEAGALQSLNLQGNFAFNLRVGDNQVLSGGLNLGMLSNNLNGEKIRFAVVDQYTIANQAFQQSYLNLSLGGFYRNTFDKRFDTGDRRNGGFVNEFYLGFSINQVNIPISTTDNPNDVFLRPKYNISLLGGVIFPVISRSNSNNLYLELSTWVRSVPYDSLGYESYISPLSTNGRLPISADMNSRLVYDNFRMPVILWGGGGYSTRGMANLEVGMYYRGNQYSSQAGSSLTSISLLFSNPIGAANIFNNAVELNLGFAW